MIQIIRQKVSILAEVDNLQAQMDFMCVFFFPFAKQLLEPVA